MKKQKYNNLENILLENFPGMQPSYKTYGDGAEQAFQDLMKKIKPQGGGGPQGPQPPQPPQPDKPGNLKKLNDLPKQPQSDQSSQGQSDDSNDTPQDSESKAQDAANKAQQAANQAQQNASNNPDSKEAQDAANKAQQAANEAQKQAQKAGEAAQKSQEAQQSGDSEGAQQAAEEAKQAARKAQQAANEAEQAANQSNQQSQSQGQGQSNTSNKSDEWLKGYKEGLEDSLKERQRSTEGMSAEEAEGYNQAQQEVEQYRENSTPTVEDPQTDMFGPDRISQDAMNKLAKEAGQPISDIDGANKDPEERAKEFVDQKLQSGVFDKIGTQGGKGSGSGIGTLGERLRRFNEKLKTHISWKNKLKVHLNKASKSRKETEFKFYTSRMSRGAINQYVKDNPKRGVSKNAISQVFYLIDGSGSMFVNGPKVFYYIMNEILVLEQSANIKASALTYFSDGLLPNSEKRPGVIRRWTMNTPKAEKMDKCLYDENSAGGGTNIPKAIKDVRKLPKPFFDNSIANGTLLVVFTDGDGGSFSCLGPIKDLPMDMKKRTVFVILEDERVCKQCEEVLKQCGVPEINIICIDSDKVQESMKKVKD